MTNLRAARFAALKPTKLERDAQLSRESKGRIRRFRLHNHYRRNAQQAARWTATLLKETA
jgi:hypothetical protein